MPSQSKEAGAEGQQSTPARPLPRPYRSKRLRPCDNCRRRKHACQFDGNPPCKLCGDAGVDCTFKEPPSKRQRRETQLQFSSLAREPIGTSGAARRLTQTATLEGILHETHMYRGYELPESSFWQTLSASGNDDLLLLDLPTQHEDGEAGFDDYIQRENQRHSTTNDSIQLLSVEQARSSDDQNCLSPSSSSSSTNEHHAAETPPTNPVTSPTPIQNLDGQEGLFSQYLGLSGEMDPYVLKHLRFPGKEHFKFLKVNYRQLASGGPTDAFPLFANQIPVYFTAADEESVGCGKQKLVKTDDAHDPAETEPELETLVDPEIGVRLVALFFRFLFPSLPLLSRTYFELKTETLITEFDVLRKTPSFLLAAIYASVIPFGRHDPVLCVSNDYTRISTSTLWRLAYKGVMRGIQMPCLAVLQTILLCLQDTRREGLSPAIADIPSHRNLLTLAASTATLLGLHLDCRTWPIPAWEKRLRRRLWWIVYSESTWRSLFIGFPHPIPHDEWSVSPLDDSDFLIGGLFLPSEESPSTEAAMLRPCPFCHKGQDFKFLATLATIAHDVYSSLYTLRATCELSRDFAASLQVARPLLQRLKHWHTQLPRYLKLDSRIQPAGRKQGIHICSGAYLKLAFLSVEVLVYRALLRPLGGTPEDIRGHTSNQRDPASANGKSTYTPDDLPEDEPFDIKAARITALDMLERAISFAQGLTSHDRNSFWYSWSRVCFSTISNFAVLLLVQATTTEMARESKNILDRWVQTLREQSVTFDQMQLGLLRLDTMVWLGLDKIFECSPNVQRALQEDPLLASYDLFRLQSMRTER